MKKYIMSEKEFNALDKVLMESHLIDELAVTQIDDTDCFMDFESDEVLTFKEGLEIVYDSDANEICFENGCITEEEFNTVKELFEKFEIE